MVGLLSASVLPGSFPVFELDGYDIHVRAIQATFLAHDASTLGTVSWLTDLPC